MNKLDNFLLLRDMGYQPITLSENSVALVLAQHRNTESMLCCPGLESLADKSKVSRKTARKAIKSLIKKKIIAKTQIMAGKRVVRTQYYFLFDIDIAKLIYNDKGSVFNQKYPRQRKYFEEVLSTIEKGE